jgi:endonuclease-3 related protein
MIAEETIMIDNKVLLMIYKMLFERFGSQHWWPGETPFEVAVGAILTQNTNWGNVEKAITRLKDRKKLHARALHEMPEDQLAALIRPAGYFNIKAKRLKEFVRFLHAHYKGNMKSMKVHTTRTLRERLLNVVRKPLTPYCSMRSKGPFLS